MFVFNDFQENTYLLYDESNECIIIDAGNYYDNENQEVLDFIISKNIKPVRLLNTHCHIDHIVGNLFFSEKFNLAPEAHIEENFLIKNSVTAAGLFGLTVKQPPVIKKYLNDLDIVRFGHSEIQCIFVPGHSRGSLAFYSKEFKFVITGDVLFNGSIGRTDLPGGDYNTIITSITERLFTLPENVIIYPGHGHESTIVNELMNNPFFQ